MWCCRKSFGVRSSLVGIEVDVDLNVQNVTHPGLITDLTNVIPPHSFPIPLPVFPVMTPLHTPGIVERIRAYHFRPSRRSGGQVGQGECVEELIDVI